MKWWDEVNDVLVGMNAWLAFRFFGSKGVQLDLDVPFGCVCLIY